MEDNNKAQYRLNMNHHQYHTFSDGLKLPAKIRSSTQPLTVLFLEGLLVSCLHTWQYNSSLKYNYRICLKLNGYTFKGGGAIFVKSFCLPSEKGSTLKGKNLLPLGAGSFLLE